MKIAAITHFKAGLLYLAMKKAGWNQSKLAANAGLSPTTISAFIRLKKRPSELNAKRIQKAFEGVGIWIDIMAEWPESFAGLNTAPVVEDFQDVSAERLISFREQRPDRLLDYKIAVSKIDELPEREKNLLKDHYLNGETYKEIADKMGVSQERVRQLSVSAIHAVKNNLGISMFNGEIQKHGPQIILNERDRKKISRCPNCGRCRRYRAATKCPWCLTWLKPPDPSDKWVYPERKPDDEFWYWDIQTGWHHSSVCLTNYEHHGKYT